MGLGASDIPPHEMPPPLKGVRVAVVVLSDLARSPRTLYHALALAQNGASVDLIGCLENPLHSAARQADGLVVHRLPSPFANRDRRGLFTYLRALARLLVLGGSLSWKLLIAVKRPDFILVQNPPGLPTLPVALLAARLRSARLLVDWHNLGWTVLALKLRSTHPFVRILRLLEVGFGRRADIHLCVSEAMRRELEGRWNISPVTVFYDRPALFFSPENRERPMPKAPLGCMSDPAGTRGPATRPPGVGGGKGGPRPAVVASSTSWTLDEDFSLLLDAAAAYDRMVELDPHRRLPPLLVLISGRGPRRSYFERRLRRLTLRRVQFRTLWLAPEEYPYLLARADLGVCVHRSSSGLDLPMKIADMLGSGLPVCAFDYGSCLGEVLRPGQDGVLFTDAPGLAQLFADLFEDLGDGTTRLGALRRELLEEPRASWPEEWERTCLPLMVRR